MMLRKLFNKLKATVTGNKEPEYKNRFLKFYHENSMRLKKERKSAYYQRQKSGTCVRCKKPRVEGIVFCTYHQQKQKEYNAKARAK
ncbi:hypothetical protein HYV86_03835 [Candidatus Woesearchaeota archaeon]|nr:hypothetical protein [Candidatus Woesearchaeota archaeon]